jgi:hypothetical protein
MAMGRPVGSKNKGPSKLLLAREACLKVGLQPFIELAKMAQSSEDENLRLRALRELASYLGPKLQAINHSGDMEAPVFINLNLGGKSEKPEMQAEGTIEAETKDDLPEPPESQEWEEVTE